jgi:peptide/nickel transport system permease protein
MTVYILRRIVALVPVLFLAGVAVFLLMRFIPGDPAVMLVGTEAPPHQVDTLRALLGIDRPMHRQFLDWMWHILQGDLGWSIVQGRPVLDILLERFPLTLSLALFAVVISLVIGIPAGIIAAVKHNSIWDRMVMLLALGGVSVPNFWLGLMLLIVFSVTLGWFPLQGFVPISESPMGSLRSLALPAFALGAVQAAIIARMMRSGLLEVLRQDYIRTARSKGLADRIVIYRHALKNALIPVVTVVGNSFGDLLGGTVVIETVFGLPGVGRFMLTSIISRDYAAVQGALLFAVFVFVFINLVVDILYVYLDPRIKYS